MVLQAVALHALGKKEQAIQVLGEALALAKPGGIGIGRKMDNRERAEILKKNGRASAIVLLFNRSFGKLTHSGMSV